MLSDDDVQFVDRGYGKNYVRLLYVRRNGKRHDVMELEVNTRLTLNDTKDYTRGDNSDIIATDSQKNTVYSLAKIHGVRSVESFAMLLCNHFMTKYSHVTHAQVYVQQAPWKRLQMGNQGKEHAHAFISSNDATRFCEVKQVKHARPEIKSGVKDLKVMKTTQSAFENFVQDEFRSLPDMKDRIFCTIVNCSWDYSRSDGFCFDAAWDKARDAILEVFAGPPDTGIYSPSVQKTMYDIQKLIMEKVPQVSRVEIVLPNVHAYEYDFKKLPQLGISTNNEVFQPTDKPSGNISSVLERKVKSML